MTQNPILKVLSTFSRCGVKSLLIGGQATILYGAAEFSRDTDFIIFCNPDNFSKIRKALRILKAEMIYFPPFEIKYLRRGHACHFRCDTPGVSGLRIDIMGKMRGCDSFSELWDRRSTVLIGKKQKIEMLGLHDLVASKRTQRDKDWLMLTRLVDNDIQKTENPSPKQINWWMRECRNPLTLKKLCRKYPEYANEAGHFRKLLFSVILNKSSQVLQLLKKEEDKERRSDRKYWRPLLNELEKMRHKK